MSVPPHYIPRAFGEDIVPCCYDGLERAKHIVLTGNNTAWCHPVLYQRIVTIDPRITQTSSLSDYHIALKLVRLIGLVL